jgi:hypothetical protein
VPIRRSDTPKVVVKPPSAPPPASPALMGKIHQAEKAQQAEQATEAHEAQEVKEVSLDAPPSKGADDVEPKKFKNQGIRGPTFQPIGMDPKQAQALGVLVLGDDDGLDKITAEQQIDDIWFSLSDKQRVVIGRAERFRVELEQKLLRMARSRMVPQIVKGQLSARLLERAKQNAKMELSRYEHLLSDDSRALVERFVEETSALIEASYRHDLIRGAPAEDLSDVQTDLVRKLVYQEMQSRLRRMGDRGIRHIIGSIDIQERIFDAMQGVVEMTPRDRFVGRVVQVHHDLGYTCHAAQVSYQAGRMHRHYSARIMNDEWNRYRRVMFSKDLQRVRDAVALHAHLDFELHEDLFASAVRIADHLMPFQNHWTHPRFAEVAGADALAQAFLDSVKTGDREQMQAPLREIYAAVNKHQGFSMNFKEDLLSGLRPFDRGAFTVDLGKLGGSFAGARYDAKDKVLEVALKPEPARVTFQSIFDVGQDQLWFFLRKRGVEEETIKAGETLNVRCRENGPVALRLFQGALPEKAKPNFKLKRGERIRGSL